MEKSFLSENVDQGSPPIFVGDPEFIFSDSLGVGQLTLGMTGTREKQKKQKQTNNKTKNKTKQTQPDL